MPRLPTPLCTICCQYFTTRTVVLFSLPLYLSLTRSRSRRYIRMGKYSCALYGVLQGCAISGNCLLPWGTTDTREIIGGGHCLRATETVRACIRRHRITDIRFSKLESNAILVTGNWRTGTSSDWRTDFIKACRIS